MLEQEKLGYISNKIFKFMKVYKVLKVNIKVMKCQMLLNEKLENYC